MTHLIRETVANARRYIYFQTDIATIDYFHKEGSERGVTGGAVVKDSDS